MAVYPSAKRWPTATPTDGMDPAGSVPGSVASAGGAAGLGHQPAGRRVRRPLRSAAAGIRAEVYLGNPKNFGNQLKYADKRLSPVAIIQGGNEAARGVVQVKDLILGAKIAAEASHEEWKAQPAQTEVPRADLVAEVRRILG